MRAATLSALFMPVVMGLGGDLDRGDPVVGRPSGADADAAVWHADDVYAVRHAVFEPLRQIARLIAELQLAQASAGRCCRFGQRTADCRYPEVIEKYGTELEPKLQNYEPLVGDVEFRHVDFEYLEGDVC